MKLDLNTIDWSSIEAAGTLIALLLAYLGIRRAIRDSREAEKRQADETQQAESRHTKELQVLREQAADALRPVPDLVVGHSEEERSRIVFGRTPHRLSLRNIGPGPMLHAQVSLFFMPIGDGGTWDFEAAKERGPVATASFPAIASGDRAPPYAGWVGDPGEFEAERALLWVASFQDCFGRSLNFESIWADT